MGMDKYGLDPKQLKSYRSINLMPFRMIAGVALFIVSSAASMACGLNWSPTASAALASANVTNRLAVVVFTGSDWSVGCARLDQEILTNLQFSGPFSGNFVLANADFPQRHRLAPALLAENTALATRYKISRWPTLLALRSDGSEFARIEYAGENVSEMTRRIETWSRDYQAEIIKGN